MILLIDSYDSFTNNLVRLVSSCTGKQVITIHNDTLKPEEYETFFETTLARFEYVVIGPGPGHPSNPGDVGIISALFRYLSNDGGCGGSPIPVLGICLGFQCLCYAFGNDIDRLSDVKHGQIYDIHPLAENSSLRLFGESDTAFPSVRYHSLFVDLAKLNDSIVPLAVCHEKSDACEDYTQILMAAKHTSLPFYGVQYHPESVCSQNGDELVANFDAIASEYNKTHRPHILELTQTDLDSTLFQLANEHPLKESGLIKSGTLQSKRDCSITAIKFQFTNKIQPLAICDYLCQKNGDQGFIFLNSASIPGEWSIIGIPIEGQSEILTHSTDNMREVKLSKYKSHESESISLSPSETTWDFLGSKIKERYVSREVINAKLGEGFHSRDLPFLGGYLGLFSYEEGQHVMVEKLESLCNGPTPDMKLIYIERFIVFDHQTNDYFIVSVSANHDEWVHEFHRELTAQDQENRLSLDPESVPRSIKDLCRDGDNISFDFPSREVYNEQFEKCQGLLHSGDSYELCLTTTSRISIPSYVRPWEIYKVLTLHKNPSPFSCFMAFDDVTLISSSPERFLSWKDGANGKKYVELRPIKGTVKNDADVTLDMATRLLKTPKEMGENLMIVDLIRHDLHEFIDQVDVTQLMAVEEYKTVFQLVSVIGGELSRPGYHGIDILHKSLPPGSMTGAPKKRSVELLQGIESLQPNGNAGGRRGVYSGVVGYWSITDDADWSVIIRSLFHYPDDKLGGPDQRLWRIGAGGAITVLSDVDSEWDEMTIKLTSALQVFQ